MGLGYLPTRLSRASHSSRLDRRGTPVNAAEAEAAAPRHRWLGSAAWSPVELCGSVSSAALHTRRRLNVHGLWTAAFGQELVHPLLWSRSCWWSHRLGVRSRSASLTAGLPAAPRRPDPGGGPAFRWHETQPGRAPSKPRGRRCPRGWASAPSRRLPLHNGQPLNPGNTTHRPGLTLTRHHQGFTHVHPSGLPLTCGPRMEREPLGLNPELRTPQLPATHARAETDLEH